MRLSLASVTVAALVFVMAMLPWSQVWKPSESAKPTVEQTQAAQAKPETIIETLRSLELKGTPEEQQPGFNVDAQIALPDSASVASKPVEAGFAETAQQLTHTVNTRCKKTYNCEQIAGTGLAAVEKAPSASQQQQQLAQAIREEGQAIQEEVRTRLERQKIEDARRAGLQAKTSSSEPYQANPQAGVTEPVLVSQVQPRYTEEAKAARIQGTVSVDITVNTDGSVTFESIRSGLGYGLDESARDAVVQWRFRPGTKDGAPVRTRVVVAMNFQLK